MAVNLKNVAGVTSDDGDYRPKFSFQIGIGVLSVRLIRIDQSKTFSRFVELKNLELMDWVFIYSI